MGKKEYRYDAFISYRHSELDKFVAEKLHKELETYKIPKNIKDLLNEEDSIKRVFRDQEELPLSSNLEDPIVEALKESKYLIVICSPRLKDSLWCKKEIETFKKLRGRKNIFCVLVEGEPNESFPKELLYDDDEKIEVEPLAADVRGNNKKEILKRIKEEKLRLIAPMFNLNYDDLKQRHKQREHKRRLAIGLSILSFFVLFSIYTSIMLIKINSQQKTLKLHQALSLAEDSSDYLNNDNRYDAIKSSYEALTKFNGVKMPYTPEAEYALSESLGMYDIGTSYKAVDVLKTKGIVDFIKATNDNKYAAIYDESSTLTLFNTKSLNVVKEFNINSNIFYEESFTFINNEYLSYINKSGDIEIVNVKDGKVVNTIKKDKDYYSSVQSDNDGKYLAYTDKKNMYVYNISDKKVLGSIHTDDKYLKKLYFSEDNNYIFASTMTDHVTVKEQEKLTIHVIEANSVKEINNYTFDAGYINGIITKGDNAYILLNDILDTKISTLVISYNYKNGSVNFQNKYPGIWGNFITKSYKEGTNNITFAAKKEVIVLDADNGNEVKRFEVSGEIINIYTFLTSDLYLVFSSDGNVNYINMELGNNVNYDYKFELNLDRYIKIIQSKGGFILLPYNDNRAILYAEKTNKDAKEVDIKLEYIKDDSIFDKKEVEKIEKEYQINNINLVERYFYSTKKDLLFINYTNGDLAIYNAKDKTLLKSLDNVGNVYHYFGKDKYNRMYIGDITDSYILDEDYNKVGHLKRLYKVDKDKLTVLYNSKYKILKIYTLDDLLNEAKKYLNE